MKGCSLSGECLVLTTAACAQDGTRRYQQVRTDSASRDYKQLLKSTSSQRMSADRGEREDSDAVRLRVGGSL